MAIYFSKITNAFYDSDIHKTMPEDVVQIEREEHKRLLNEQSNGKIITSNSKGKPIATDIVKTDEELINACKSRASNLLNETDWTQAVDCPLKNKEEFVEYRKSLRTLVLNPVANPVFPVKPKTQW